MKLPRSTFLLGSLVGGISAVAVPLLLELYWKPAQGETKLLPFQGRLTDAAGSTIADGAKVVEFKMYDAPTGGNVKWAGEVHKLSVNGGLVNTMLGTKAGLGSVDFASPTFLQITVDANGDGAITAADPPLLPRQSVVGAVYAAVAGGMQYRLPDSSVQLADWSAVFDNGRPDTGRIATAKLATDNGITAAMLAPTSVDTAELVANAVTLAKMAENSVGTAQLIGSDAAPAVEGAVTSEKIQDGTIQPRDLSTGLQNAVTPPGAVIAYASSNEPPGWLLCDGRAVSRTTYAALFAAIGTTHGVGDGASTFNLPDYRGRFLRGVDDPDGAGGLAAAGRDPDAGLRTAMATGGNVAGSVGSLQEDEFESHSHSSRGAHQVATSGITGYWVLSEQNLNTGIADRDVQQTGGSETRPKNAYVNYLIKL